MSQATRLQQLWRKGGVDYVGELVRLVGNPVFRHNLAGVIRRYITHCFRSVAGSDASTLNFVMGSILSGNSDSNELKWAAAVGLHEFSDMAFITHLLQPGELFVDVGANIGSYTVLASRIAGARTIAIEPIPSTFVHLQHNIELNGISDLVRAMNIGLSDCKGSLEFTCLADTRNCVLVRRHGEQGIAVPVRTLDEVVGHDSPCIIKVDTEGHESQVITGGQQVLRSPSLLAVILEDSVRQGDRPLRDREAHHLMVSHGFRIHTYNPFTRRLVPAAKKRRLIHNYLYVRDRELCQARTVSANPIVVYGLTA